MDGHSGSVSRLQTSRSSSVTPKSSSASSSSRSPNARLVDALWSGDREPSAHRSTPFDRASFHGYADIVEMLLTLDPNPSLSQHNEFGGTPPVRLAERLEDRPPARSRAHVAIADERRLIRRHDAGADRK
jgi:hypothetical protein